MKLIFLLLKNFKNAVIIICSVFFIFNPMFSNCLFSQSLVTNSALSCKADVRDFLSDSLKKNNKVKQKFEMKKKPWTAVAYSAVLPGAGQFYNESYWKIPVILGLGGYFTYELIKNNNSYLDYKEQYINSQTPENPNGDPNLKNLREFYLNQRDDFIIYDVILYVVNLIDAYVDAQLYDFNVSDKINLGFVKKNKLVNLSIGF